MNNIFGNRKTLGRDGNAGAFPGIAVGVPPAKSNDGERSRYRRQMDGEYMKHLIELVAFRRRDAHCVYQCYQYVTGNIFIPSLITFLIVFDILQGNYVCNCVQKLQRLRPSRKNEYLFYQIKSCEDNDFLN